MRSWEEISVFETDSSWGIRVPSSLANHARGYFHDRRIELKDPVEMGLSQLSQNRGSTILTIPAIDNGGDREKQIMVLHNVLNEFREYLDREDRR